MTSPSRALSADPNWIGFPCDVLPSGCHHSRTTSGLDVGHQYGSRWDPLQWRKSNPVVVHLLLDEPRPDFGSPCRYGSESDHAHADGHFLLADGHEARVGCGIPVKRTIPSGSILHGDSPNSAFARMGKGLLLRFRSSWDRSSLRRPLVTFN